MTLATGCARGWLDLARDLGDLGANLRPDVALDEVVDLVEAREGADGLVGEVDSRVDQHLLGELDDRAVGAADVLARAALGAQARRRPG